VSFASHLIANLAQMHRLADTGPHATGITTHQYICGETNQISQASAGLKLKITPRKMASGVHTCRVQTLLPCGKGKLHMKHRFLQDLVSAHLASELRYSLCSVPLSQL